MSTAEETTTQVFHGKTRDFTDEEFDQLADEMLAAYKRGDMREGDRLAKILPVHPTMAKAVRNVHGKQYLLSLGLDLTEAEYKFGKGWIDEPYKG